MPLLPPTPEERRAEVEALKAEQTPIFSGLMDRLMNADARLMNRPRRIGLDPERWKWLETELAMLSGASPGLGRKVALLWMPWGSVEVVSTDEART